MKYIGEAKDQYHNTKYKNNMNGIFPVTNNSQIKIT